MKIEKFKFLVEAKEGFLKILALLRDQQIWGFTFSVKLYYDDFSQPKTISIQRMRSADDDWHTWSPKNLHPDLLQSHEILKERLANITENVDQYILKNSLDEDWRKLKALIVEALNSGISTEFLEYISIAPMHALAASSYDAVDLHRKLTHFAA